MEKKKTILCYGDSNTYGYNPLNGLRYPSDVRWTGRLQMLLGPFYHVVEEGCNGRTAVCVDPEESWKSGLPYLRPCLNSHKPIDIVIMMLGSNDLKKIFHASAKEIAEGAGKLVDVVKEFTQTKQGYQPQIILVSPPEIGEGIMTSPFSRSFAEDSIARSKEFSKYYQIVAEERECIFFDAAAYIESSEADSLHLTPKAHAVLAKKLVETIQKKEGSSTRNSSI